MERAPGLSRQIFQDLTSVGKVPLVLLLLVLISALSVVFVTQQTRTAIAHQDQLLMERERLEVEWRNQILEEHALSEHSRVESMARNDQDMIRPDSRREIIVSQ
ncbi:cell division protein FtsL [Enterovibrio norvegicus FF-33]|uniref:Cell division protein FtsL n=1 Tax=Enterovibrio norvegicus FF-454 TaxID=1185651 RepID=A0A1E5BXH1_9GAMM|nr:cell division protein FtsL [Enterovibrio norvegicus]OEE57921.1 cell division protein FtsL [Enterovibrio norvegicus FF-454]OEE70560.1 cell division protein FtsL [Enterovibrio norvegicus FF-33]OEE81439.1 cell division protein FtsL [Enterovibrio norvegicus FF-162]